MKPCAHFISRSPSDCPHCLALRLQREQIRTERARRKMVLESATALERTLVAQERANEIAATIADCARAIVLLMASPRNVVDLDHDARDTRDAVQRVRKVVTHG